MKNLLREALFDKLAFNAAMILVGLVLLAISLQKAPLSMGYIKMALIDGGICALIVFLFIDKNLAVGVWILIPQPFFWVREIVQYFEKDILQQYQGWLMVQWMMIVYISILAATCIVVRSYMRKSNKATEEKPSP